MTAVFIARVTLDPGGNMAPFLFYFLIYIAIAKADTRGEGGKGGNLPPFLKKWVCPLIRYD